MRSDTPEGKDPDAYSPTLKKYHKYLWSKKTKSGVTLNLNTRKATNLPFLKSKNFLTYLIT